MGGWCYLSREKAISNGSTFTKCQLLMLLFPGQRDKVLLLLQEENEEEKVRSIEMTARLRENSEISKSRK